jgi:hypothetical protein
MNINDMYPSKYIKSDDLGGAAVDVVVMAVVMEEVGDKEFKPVMRFMSKDKGMVLNKTNALNCAATWGDDTNLWQGKHATLMAQPVMFQGKQVMGLVILPKVAPPAQQAPQQPQPAQSQGQQWDTPPQAPHGPAGTLQELANDIAMAEQKRAQLQPGDIDPADLPF